MGCRERVENGNMHENPRRWGQVQGGCSWGKPWLQDWKNKTKITDVLHWAAGLQEAMKPCLGWGALSHKLLLISISTASKGLSAPPRGRKGREGQSMTRCPYSSVAHCPFLTPQWNCGPRERNLVLTFRDALVSYCCITKNLGLLPQ